jgi:hypothetical protein
MAYDLLDEAVRDIWDQIGDVPQGASIHHVVISALYHLPDGRTGQATSNQVLPGVSQEDRKAIGLQIIQGAETVIKLDPSGHIGRLEDGRPPTS